MKKLLNYITAALFLSLFVFASCGGTDSPDPEDPLDIAAESFSGNFELSKVTKPANATELDWTALTVSFTGTKAGGNFTTTGSANTDVWPASGTWTFSGTTGKKILRSDDVEMTLTPSKPNLKAEFTISTASNVKTNVVEGIWSFEFAIK